MDVKFINPFIYATVEVMETMAFVKPVAAKPFAKTDEIARGEVSGIIGMTGDALGSLAMSFSESCIIGIVDKMLGEKHTEMNRAVLDAVGELTNMISGSARKRMEKDNLKVSAAIPTIVFGRSHTVRHVVKGPSIVIPFKTDFGEFVIDISLKSNIKQMPRPAQTQADQKTPFDPKAHNPAVFGRPSMPEPGPDILQSKIETDLGAAAPVEHKTAAERMEYLRKVLVETNATRDAIMKQLKEQPFMEYSRRQRYRKALPAYDAKIKRLKLDIAAAETIMKMSKEDLENPTIKPHFQHYPNTSGQSKPEPKK
ncbi:MAG TPA: chemotaxis protein CheX [Smithellaceae bacterium]|nr:chemotaxis protein CheX [Smithellaceae bacterium]HQF84665.1 chemotaxis protein CheX [Smithellaceae bacterium]HQG80215.1 chemotaxis protein CheX [Smithellaceae bacterium]